jgi:hypothetical protein
VLVMRERPEFPDTVVERVLVEMGVLPAPQGHRFVPWHWGKGGAGSRVVHRRDCLYGTEAHPWFWAGDRYPDAASLLAHLPEGVRPCPHCLG